MSMIIESARLILRVFNETDAETAFQWLGDSEVMKFIPYGHDKTVQESSNRIKGYIEHFNKYGFSKYVVIEKGTARLIGDCGIMNLHGLNLNELGYRISKDCWGKGFATEAAQAVLKYTKEMLGFDEIHAVVANFNLTSVHMLRNKLGFCYLKKIQCFGQELDLYYLDLIKKPK